MSDTLVVYLDNSGFAVEDEAAAACFDYVAKALAELDACVSSYLAAMNGLVQNAVIEGETADALRQFIQQAAHLQGVYSSMRGHVVQAKNGFLQEVGAADNLKLK